MKTYYFPNLYGSSAFWGTLAAFNRRRELNRLIQWASLKDYQQPLCLYRWRLQDEEMRISRYRLRCRREARFAHIIHILNTIFFPTPRYFRPGAASHYN